MNTFHNIFYYIIKFNCGCCVLFLLWIFCLFYVLTFHSIYVNRMEFLGVEIWNYYILYSWFVELFTRSECPMHPILHFIIIFGCGRKKKKYWLVFDFLTISNSSSWKTWTAGPLNNNCIASQWFVLSNLNAFQRERVRLLFISHFIFTLKKSRKKRFFYSIRLDKNLRSSRIWFT